MFGAIYIGLSGLNAYCVTRYGTQSAMPRIAEELEFTEARI